MQLKIAWIKKSVTTDAQGIGGGDKPWKLYDQKHYICHFSPSWWKSYACSLICLSLWTAKQLMICGTQIKMRMSYKVSFDRCQLLMRKHKQIILFEKVFRNLDLEDKTFL